MVTTNKTATKDTHKIKRKEPKHSTKENQQTTNEETWKKKEKGEKLQNQLKKMNKIISTYFSIITLNVNKLHAPIKRHRVAAWIEQKTHLYAAYKRLAQIEKHMRN